MKARTPSQWHSKTIRKEQDISPCHLLRLDWRPYILHKSVAMTQTFYSITCFKESKITWLRWQVWWKAISNLFILNVISGTICHMVPCIVVCNKPFLEALYSHDRCLMSKNEKKTNTIMTACDQRKLLINKMLAFVHHFHFVILPWQCMKNILNVW